MKKCFLLLLIVISITLYGTANAAPEPLSPGTIVLKDGAPAGPYNFALGSEFAVPNNTTMTTNSIGEKSEFRLIGITGSVIGGEKSLFGVRDDGAVGDNGTNRVAWTIGDGIVIATNGDLSPGANNSQVRQATGLTTNGLFFGSEFGFVGGGSANPIFATVDYTTNKLMFDTAFIEFQWGGTFFPLGLADPNNECNTDGQGCGIHFKGDIVPRGNGAFDFTIFAEHRITPWEAIRSGDTATVKSEGIMQWAWSGTYIPAPTVTTLTFADNSNPVDPFPSLGTWPLLELTYTTVFSATPPSYDSKNSEFRMISTGNVVGGGGHKNLFDGGEQWIFGDDINLTAVGGTDLTPGSSISGSAEPEGGTGLFKTAPFKSTPFGFLAPVVGSPAAAKYGNGTIAINVTESTIQVVFPVLEAQWGGAYFPLGLADDSVRGDKITFDGTLSNVQLDAPETGFMTFDFILTAEHVITSDIEDPGMAGFQNWTPQWNLTGSGVARIVTLHPPSTTDTISATLPGTTAKNGRITHTELDNLYDAPTDTEVGSSCVGSCFAFTITGVTDSTQVVLPLSAPIPDNAIYRKLINGSWITFDDSSGDTIESGPGEEGDCSAPIVYSPGLSAGDFCVRLTIADAGPNDSDSLASPDGVVIDPGGVALPLNSTGNDTGNKSSGDSGSMGLFGLAVFLFWRMTFAFRIISRQINVVKKIR